MLDVASIKLRLVGRELGDIHETSFVSESISPPSGFMCRLLGTIYREHFEGCEAVRSFIHRTARCCFIVVELSTSIDTLKNTLTTLFLVAFATNLPSSHLPYNDTPSLVVVLWLRRILSYS